MYVDVVETEALQALVKAGEEVLGRAKVAIRAGPHVPAGLGGDDQLVAKAPEVVVEDPGEVALGAPVWRPVVVRQVEVGDAQVEGSAHNGTLGVERPVVAEVLPQPKRHGRQEQTAGAAAAIWSWTASGLRQAGRWSCRRPSGFRRCSLMSEHLGDDAEVVPAEALINGLLPFVGKAG